MVIDPSPLAALVEFFQEISLQLSASRFTLSQFLDMLDSTRLISSFTVEKVPTS